MRWMRWWRSLEHLLRLCGLALGDGEKCVFKACAGDFEAVQRGIGGEHLAQHRLRGFSVDEQGFAILRDAGHAGQSADPGGVESRNAADAAAAGLVLDLRRRAMGY